MRGVVSTLSRSLALVVGVGLLAGCAAMHEYDDVVLNRNHCDSGQCGAPWGLYRDMTSGRNPCAGDTCGCRPKPVCAPACAPACPPKPACGPSGRPVSVAPDAFPADAKPGEAWCRVVTPARQRTVVEPVTTVCAGVDRVWVPPVTEIRLRRVCIAPATESVICTPGATRTDVICAEACPARTEMRTVTEQGPCGCTTRCEPVTIPATTCTTKREVCIQAPDRRVVTTPAEYVEEACLVEVTPGRWVEKPRPAVVEMRSRLVCEAPERVEWRRNPNCEVPAPTVVAPCAPASRK